MAKKKRSENKEKDENGVLSKIFSTLFVILIIIIWLGIFAALIRFDVGGFGSSILRPVLKDVPVINKILPPASAEELEKEAEESLAENQIATLSQAKELIESLQASNEELTQTNKDLRDEISDYQLQIERLKVFEDNQIAFQEEKEKFYSEIVYGENAPSADTYIEWYESIDPANAEAIYRQLISQDVADEELKALAKTYENMKPSEAAAVLEKMKYDLDTVATILRAMKVDSRAKIMNELDPTFAANITKKLMP